LITKRRARLSRLWNDKFERARLSVQIPPSRRFYNLRHNITSSFPFSFQTTPCQKSKPKSEDADTSHGRPKNFTVEEDVCLARADSRVATDPEVGNQQTINIFWERGSNRGSTTEPRQELEGVEEPLGPPHLQGCASFFEVQKVL